MRYTELWLSPLQFFVSLGFMSLFFVIELGLAWVLLFFKVQSQRTGDPAWTGAYRFWVRVFALAFILTFAASMPVLIQFGSLWPRLMEKIGEVAGPLLAAAILSTFVFKSCFLGAMLFGQRRLSGRAHTAVVLMVALGATFAAFWIIVLLSWMQTPAGAILVDDQYQVVDWTRVLLNPSLGWTASVLGLTSALTVALLMMGITARQTLLHPIDDSGSRAFKTALAIAMASILLIGLAAIGTGKMVARYQPAKAAATAGYWHSGTQARIALFALPNSVTRSNDQVWGGFDGGAFWLGKDAQGRAQGLDQFSGMSPPVALTFWSFRLMVLAALAMGIVSWLTFFRVRNKQFNPAVLSVAWRRVLVAMTFSGWVVCLAGLCHTLFGLYPYAVNGTVTLSEISGQTPAKYLGAGIVAYLIVYGVLLAGFLRLLGYIERYGVVPVARIRGHA